MRFLTLPTSFTSQIMCESHERYLRSAFVVVCTIILAFATAVTALAQDEQTVLATIGDIVITQREVDESVGSRIFPLQQQLYALRKVALDNLILKYLLEREAKRKNISVEELRKKLMDGPVNISRGEVETAYQQNSSFFAMMSPDEARERLRLDLETQGRMKNYRAGLENLRGAYPIVVKLFPPVTTSATQDIGSPATGSSSPLITIVEFSDFQCPFCASVQPILRQVLQEYAGAVKLVFKHLPLDIHRNAMSAARAAYCAGRQERFWQYHDALFDAKTLSAESYNRLAQSLGLNLQTFQSCLNSIDSLNAITSDVEFARSLKIESTPSFVINNRIVSGAISFSEFEKIINLELQRSSAKGSSSN
jgi:predicted DsbA family dithiol-disulfide isomerase